MQQTQQHLTSSDLKTILHSKRANIYYIEHCRVMQKDGRILYLTESDKENLYWNIPIANTTCIILGTGTSITQAAIRMLAGAGVLVGFSGGGGTPLFMGTEIEWFTPQSEYRPTEYIQGWLSWWFDDQKRLQAAKYLQQARVKFLRHAWDNDRELKAEGFDAANPELTALLAQQQQQIALQDEVSHLLQLEARFTKKLYKFAAQATQHGEFTREREAGDRANIFLNHGNYLAYGLAATTTWVLGIPHGFAVMHGKTRRGALVFDIADLIKDAIVLPLAFICAKEQATEQEFRQECLRAFTQHKVLDFMFDVVKQLALSNNASGE
ncbi:type I-F CRISPR-associated endonuclease Cas1f [Pasteurella testudinis]|nr:type I-F CRISPR-associated endonuclease Cas1f [Pasteurella testudinis]